MSGSGPAFSAGEAAGAGWREPAVLPGSPAPLAPVLSLPMRSGLRLGASGNASGPLGWARGIVTLFISKLPAVARSPNNLLVSNTTNKMQAGLYNGYIDSTTEKVWVT